MGGVDYQFSSNILLGARYLRNHLRHAIEDLSVRVDNVDTYILPTRWAGMATTLTATTGLTAPFAYPKAVRDYDALEITASRRLAQGWFGQASYTWSQLSGNYAGLADSDELRTPTTNIANPVAQRRSGSISRSGGYCNDS